MTEDPKPTKIECKLCRKEKIHTSPFTKWRNEIDAWSNICHDCFKMWELGKKRAKSSAGEGPLVFAKVVLKMNLDGRRLGDPEVEPVIKSADLVTAMGGTKLRGSKLGERWAGSQGEIHIGGSKEGLEYGVGAAERIEVPKARAEAMKRVVTAFLHAIAAARVVGFNEGRDLLACLARGSVKLEDYDERVDNARAGKRPTGD